MYRLCYIGGIFFLVQLLNCAGEPPSASVEETEITTSSTVDTVDHWEPILDSVVAIQQQDGNTAAIAGAQSLLNDSLYRRFPPSPSLGMLWHRLGVFHYLLDQYDEAETAFRQAISVREWIHGASAEEVGMSSHNLGVVLKEKGNYTAAIPALKRAADIRQAAEDIRRLARSYQELGIVYERSGDYDNALDFHQTAHQLFLQQHEPPHNNTARSHQAIGIIYRKQGNYKEALRSMQQALTEYEALFGHQDADVAATYNNLGNIYDDQGDYPAAIAAYEESLEIELALDSAPNLDVAKVYNNLAYTTRRMGLLDQAYNYQSQALEIRQSLIGPYHPRIGNAHANLGDILVEQGNLDDGLAAYRQAIPHWFTNFRDSTGQSLPTLEQHTLVGAGVELLVLLRDLAEALQQRYLSNERADDLQAALRTYQVCDELIDHIRQGYESDLSILFLLEQAVPIYEGALACVYELHQQEPQASYLEEAFRLMEKSKSVLLLSSIKESRARYAAGIPDSLLRQENDLKADIAYLQQQLAERELAGDSEDSTLLSYRRQLLNLRQDYDQLVAGFEEQYPAYYREKYDDSVADLESVRAHLAANQQSLVAYFAGEKDGYALAIGPEDQRLIRLTNFESLTTTVRNCLRGLQSPDDLQQSEAWYNASAHQLYQRVWEPLAGLLAPRTVIVPAGILGYLPFEVLLTEAVGGIPFKDYPFLLREQQLSYAYSATVLLENSRPSKRRADRSLLALAPVFDAGNEFPTLPYSEEEVQEIAHLGDGQVLLREQATKEAFQQEAGQYRMIHLSSHASALDSTGSGAWIAFSPAADTSAQGHKLYLADLYAMDIPADLAVLSACETGLGHIAGGEGVMSLARGFAFAGCQSIITTLWQVNHGSTTRIMEQLYAQLLDGAAKDEALHQAQLAYLNDPALDNIGRHPYYWSAYRQIGNVAPVDLPGRGRWLWWLVGAVLAGGIRWYIGTRRR